MIGRTPGHIRAVQPLRDGVIADYDVTAQMLRYFLRKVMRHRFSGPRVVVCVPCGVTSVEQRAVSESAYAAGARRVHIISEPMAAAIGAGLPVNQAFGSMIVDIGGGTTEVAVLALGGVVASTSLRVAGNALDDAIVEHVRERFSLLIGERTAEELKINLGSAFPVAGPQTAEIRGRDIGSGLPRNVTHLERRTPQGNRRTTHPDRRGGALNARSVSARDRRRPGHAGDRRHRRGGVAAGSRRAPATRHRHPGAGRRPAAGLGRARYRNGGRALRAAAQSRRRRTPSPRCRRRHSGWPGHRGIRASAELAAAPRRRHPGGRRGRFVALDLTGSSLSEAHAGGRGLLGTLYRGTDSVLGPVRRYVQALPDAAHNSARVSPLENENAKLQAQLAANAQDKSTG